MSAQDQKQKTHKRKFLESLATGAAALGLASFISPQTVEAKPSLSLFDEGDADKWFDRIKGKHKMVFDATQPHDTFPFACQKFF